MIPFIRKARHHKWPLATWLLIAMAFILLLAYPSRHAFWGAFFFHLGAAGLIGGLADWYAVTALFTRPLGIPFKTAIIPESRDRFIALAHHMVMEELLKVSHMYAVIKEEHIPIQIMQYIRSQKGHDQLDLLMKEVIQHMGPILSSGEVKDELKKALVEGVSTWKITPLLLTFFRRLLAYEKSEIIWIYMNRMARRVLGSAALHPYLERMIADMMDRYASDSFFRELTLAIGIEELTPHYIAMMVQRKGCAFLEKQEALSSPLGTWVYRKVTYLVEELDRNEAWQETIERKKESFFLHMMEEREVMDGEWLAPSWWQKKLEDYAGTVLLDEEKQETIERLLRYQVLALLKVIRPYVDRLITTALEGYNGEQMSEAIRTRWYHDFQMIRWNGTFVGALLGALFYLLHEGLKGGLVHVILSLR